MSQKMATLFLKLLCFAFVCFARAQFVGDECTLAHNKAIGICKSSYSCPKIIQLYKQGLPFTTCSYLGGEHIVCCPAIATSVSLQASHQSQRPLNNLQSAKPLKSVSNDRISVQKCAEYKSRVTKIVPFAALTPIPKISVLSAETCLQSTGLIVGGSETKIGEFPHMCAIGARRSDAVEFFCGGSLISDKFVLTAAHCRENLKESIFVRLGVRNIRNQGNEQQAIDILISEFIKHEHYKRRTRQNDIAVMRLSRAVVFTNYVRPACLWQSFSIHRTKATATGYGSVEWQGKFSNNLLKVQLDILDQSVCETALGDELLINRNQLCAGILSGGHDTCQGDSGGPLQIVNPDNKCIYSIIGITSFGIGCGEKNSPAVYTRVSSYIDWIESKVWSS